MDMQGEPVGNTSSGAKNTSDPSRYTNPTIENPGTVTSDSLAAESDTFASRNPTAATSSVPGSSSTVTNTDTSAATTLDPTSSSAARSTEETYNESAGKDSFAKVTGSRMQQSGETYEAGQDTAYGGVAPSYASIPAAPGSQNPAGKNLTEGGFESSDAKNASFNTDIGGKGDPGRLAEEGFQKMNANIAGGGVVGGGGMRGGEGEVSQPYEVLGREEDA